MEGGIGILLLLIILGAVVFAVLMYATGGAIIGRGKGEGGGAPPKGVTDPVEENTTRMRTGGESHDS
jgi:hypothetical protein